MTDDMPARMRRFLASPPKRLSEEAIAARTTKCVRRSKPRGLLEELSEAQRWRCYYCTRSMRRKPRADKPYLTATLDHMLPISRGGRNQRWNLVAACQGCNKAKGSMTAEEFIARRAPVDRSPQGQDAAGGLIGEADERAVTGEAGQAPK